MLFLETLTREFLTGLPFDKPYQLKAGLGTLIEYYHPAVKNVRIGVITAKTLENGGETNPELAGFCRNYEGDNLPIITREFIRDELPKLKLPRTFEDKTLHTLKYIYSHGGEDYKSIFFDPRNDFTISYAKDREEFERILAFLKDRGLIEFNLEQVIGGVDFYQNVLLTATGFDKVRESLPKIPMFGLVEQTITTGRPDMDETINHAKELFFKHPQTLDSMRSSCEALSYVIEPLKGEIQKVISSKDVSVFFQIVNDFDIRHNKNHTKTIEHPEQLEWIFYSLLNTINMYIKLIKRLSAQL